MRKKCSLLIKIKRGLRANAADANYDSCELLFQLIAGQKQPHWRVKFTTKGLTKFFLVSREKSAPTASWTMRSEDIEGLSPAQIAAKLSLPVLRSAIGDAC